MKICRELHSTSKKKLQNWWKFFSVAFPHGCLSALIGKRSNNSPVPVTGGSYASKS